MTKLKGRVGPGRVIKDIQHKNYIHLDVHTHTFLHM